MELSRLLLRIRLRIAEGSILRIIVRLRMECRDAGILSVTMGSL